MPDRCESSEDLSSPDSKTVSASCLDPRVLEAFRPYLLAIANRELDDRIRPKIAASDVVQESLLEAHQAYAGFHGETTVELRAWLRSILRNNLSNQRRRFQKTGKRLVAREVSLDDHAQIPLRTNLADHSPTAATHVTNDEEMARLQVAMQNLPPDVRQIVVWRNLELQSFVQIASALKRSEKSVQKQWSRAIRALQIEMARLP